jgi:predicted transcriptional regulator
MAKWNFFTNYGHVLFVLAIEPDLTLREVSFKVGITERAVQRIIADLDDDGFLKITKQGRRNHYEVRSRKNLNHEIEKKCKISDLIKLIQNQKS